MTLVEGNPPNYKDVNGNAAVGDKTENGQMAPCNADGKVEELELEDKSGVCTCQLGTCNVDGRNIVVN